MTRHDDSRSAGDPQSMKEKFQSQWENKRGMLSTPALKIGLGILIVGGIFYLIFFKALRSDVVLVLSPNEINSADDASFDEFKMGSKIFFHVTGRKETLEAGNVTLEIQYYDGDDYKRYKQIKFEIDRDFKRLHSYVPQEYFQRAGKYKIIIYLDGEKKLTEKIEVEK